jgi:hypothetical protein
MLWGNRWNILGFNFTKRDVLSSVYKISMLVLLQILFLMIWILFKSLGMYIDFN